MLIINMTQVARVLKGYVMLKKIFERQQENAITSFDQKLVLVFKLLLTKETPNKSLI